jgi:1-acyl-sn-glycerol-3-phosphate acyltransferase
MTPYDSADSLKRYIPPVIGKLSRWLAEVIFGTYVWTLLIVILLPASAIIVLLQDIMHRRGFARSAARLFFRCAGVHIRAYGLEKLPRVPHLLIVNHTSFVDAIVLAALLPTQPGYAFTARQQFPVQSLFCPLLRSLGTLVLHPHDAHHISNIRLFTTTLARRKNMVIFPEGRIRPEPGLNAFHHGAFVAATQAQVPVVVAALRGTREALRLGTWLPRRTLIELEIGPVLIPEGQDSESIARLHHTARMAMLPLTREADLTADKIVL